MAAAEAAAAMHDVFKGDVTLDSFSVNTFADVHFASLVDVSLR